MSREPFTFEKDVVAIHDTPDGLKLRIDGTQKTFWVPKEAIHDDSEVWKPGQEGKLIVAEWFAEKRSWF